MVISEEKMFFALLTEEEWRRCQSQVQGKFEYGAQLEGLRGWIFLSSYLICVPVAISVSLWVFVIFFSFYSCLF